MESLNIQKGKCCIDLPCFRQRSRRSKAGGRTLRHEVLRGADCLFCSACFAGGSGVEAKKKTFLGKHRKKFYVECSSCKYEICSNTCENGQRLPNPDRQSSISNGKLLQTGSLVGEINSFVKSFW